MKFKVFFVCAIVVILIGLGYGIDFNRKRNTIGQQIVVQAIAPPIRSTNGIYGYRAYPLSSAANTTRITKVEIHLTGRAHYSGTKNLGVWTPVENWTLFDNNDVKGAEGNAEDDVFLQLVMDDSGVATSYTQTDFVVYVTFKYETFFRDFYPTVGYVHQVPGPYASHLVAYRVEPDEWQEGNPETFDLGNPAGGWTFSDED